MPELPEVETTRRGIAPHITGKAVTRVLVRKPRLRWPVPRRLAMEIAGQTITAVGRRGKYLLLATDTGTAIIHLGMSGNLRIIDATTPAGKHDHVTDPRRFGALLWTRRPPEQHRLLRDMGPEPLGAAFTGAYLHDLSRGRKIAIKHFIMNSHIVVGIGNIYANEALYMAGIHPGRAAGRISERKYELLVEVIREVLNDSIARGGTSLRDFVDSDGKPGYFSLDLNVYGKGGEPCISCRTLIRKIRQGQRATFYCPECQH
jgi:formamidopyrimidine-DNA glycosylase